jgi:imidazole glycerol-phosphate synthase subunit HisH
MITIIDYGVGNLRSVQKAIEYLGYKVQISSEASVIKKAQLLILPGQGAFSEAMKNLERTELVPYIKEFLQDNRPFLGICVGFQILFEESYEHGTHKGLGVFKGCVKKFASRDHKIPHMGWNTIEINQDKNGIFQNLKEKSFTYFVHSYYVETSQTELISTTTNYAGIDFTSSIQKENLLATQFHPEKSGKVGLEILSNFFRRSL